MSFPARQRARPTVDHLLDHTARQWRPAELAGTLGSRSASHVLVGVVACAVKRPQALLLDAGPGLTPTGERVLYLKPTEEVLTLDVFELVSGPDTGAWEVNGPPTTPRGHHIEARARHFSGQLPDAGS
jgi:hypothetical protein